MNQRFAAIFGDIYSLVNCRGLSDKLGCIRSCILLLGLVQSAVYRNILSHLSLNGSILLDCLSLIRLILLLLIWWSLDMRNSDVEQALCWLIIYNTALEVFDHRFQRSTDVLTVELLMLRFFRNLLLFLSLYWSLQGLFHILNGSMDLFLNLSFLLGNVSTIFSFCHIYLVGNILNDRLRSKR